jgi:dihydrodipicolinate synthase/N-acetylneuraminate lyase
MLSEVPILAPLLSPFTDDGSQLSEVRLAKSIRWHRDRGAAGFLLGGESGEYWALAFSERKHLIEWAMREAGEAQVYVHVSAPTTAAVLDLCQTAARGGAAGVVVMVPQHSPLTEDEVRGFAAGIKRYAGTPTVVIDQAKQVVLESGGVSWTPLAGSTLQTLAVGRGLWLEEAIVDGRLLSPAAAFGADRLRLMAENWMKWKIRVGSLFMKDRGARIAKTLMQETDCDLGSPRAPLMVLDDQGRAVLNGVLSDLEREEQAL